MKRLRTDEPVTKETKQEFRNEAEAMAGLNKDKSEEAKYIIKLYGVCTGNILSNCMVCLQVICFMGDGLLYPNTSFRSAPHVETHVFVPKHRRTELLSRKVWNF